LILQEVTAMSLSSVSELGLFSNIEIFKTMGLLEMD
jgi:hypothetical protein